MVTSAPILRHSGKSDLRYWLSTDGLLQYKMQCNITMQQNKKELTFKRLQSNQTHIIHPSLDNMANTLFSPVFISCI